MKRILFELIRNKRYALLTVLLCMLSYSNTICSQTYTLSVGESVNVSQSTYNGGYIDNVGLAAFIDPHLSFAKNYDGSAKITVNSYFDYTATVKLVFIERYQSYYSGRNHTRAATYYKDVSIKCSYVAPKPNVKPTKVLLPERVRVPLDKRVDIYPTYEPYGAKGTKFSWDQWQGTAVFSHGEYNDGGYHVTGRSPGLGEVSVKVDNSLYASTVIEVVDPNNLPPDNVFLPSNIEISVGGHTTLEPILVPEGTSTSYTWSSDNSNIATVSYGKVTGVKVGSTKIIVKTANDLQTTCTVNVVSANGKDDEDDNGTQTTGNIDGHDYIDLGLSVKWATCNVGASKPENFGSYFAWGETSEKSSYSWDNYKYGSNALNCRNIGNDISGTSYDAAYVNWGSNWRMPNEKEMGELISKCSITKATQNGVDGFLVTGPNGNSIFLPTANAKFSTSSSGCRYWTSTVDDYNGRSLFINYSNGKISPALQSRARPMGLPIRAVTSISTSIPKAKLSLSANPSGGSITSDSKVYLTASVNGSTVSGVSIYYTLNGNKPTTSSNKYTSSGITINESCTLKAFAIKSGYDDSDVMTWNFTVSMNEDIEINSTNFPDKAFRDWILNQDYGKDGKLTAEEISKITKIEVSGNYSNPSNISSLIGIEYFTALTNLNCSYNQLTALDVSKNTTLTSLLCDDNQLTALDVSKNTALTRLSCYNNQLTVFDVSKNTALKELFCGGNQLTALDVSKNTALTSLYCHANQLTRLDVSKNTALTILYCSYNLLTTLDVSKNTSLTSVFCDGNQLKALDVSKNTALTGLGCGRNQLKALDVSKNMALGSLSCDSNQLTALDVSKNTALTSLYCYSNQLKALDMSKNTALTRLYCYNNQLTALDVSKNTALTRLSCYNNQLTALDVSKNTVLTLLDCQNNLLTALDLSKNTELTGLYCHSNRLTALNVSKNMALGVLNCSSNQLTVLDVSKNTELFGLYCINNQLTALNVSRNTALGRLYCYNNQIRGRAMDNLINSLRINSSGTKYEFYVFAPTEENEGNVCTKAQVAAAKAKGWIPYYYNGTEWLEYEGSDASDVKAIKKDSEADAPTYNLRGQRLAAPQKGINIIGGKKVVVK